MIHEPDHASAAVARLVSQYRDVLSVRAIAALMASPLQPLEDAAFVLWGETVDNAEGESLDVLGRLVGQAREGRDDAAFRLWIKVRAKINRSCGTPEEILAIFRALTSGSVPLVLEEVYPAEFRLRLGATATLDPVQGSAILQRAKPAGVRATLIGATSSDAGSFAFSPNGAGFGSVYDGALGGTLATAIS